MGFIGELIQGVTKVVISPIVIVHDIIHGEDRTIDLVSDAVDHTIHGCDDLINGEIS